MKEPTIITFVIFNCSNSPGNLFIIKKPTITAREKKQDRRESVKRYIKYEEIPQKSNLYMLSLWRLRYKSIDIILNRIAGACNA